MRIILPRLNEYKSEQIKDIKKFSEYLLEKVQDDEFEGVLSRLINELEHDPGYNQSNLEIIIINWYDSNVQSEYPEIKIYNFRAETNSSSQYKSQDDGDWAWADLCFFFEDFGVYITISSDENAMFESEYNKYIFEDLNTMRTIFKERSDNKQKITTKNLDMYLEIYQQ